MIDLTDATISMDWAEAEKYLKYSEAQYYEEFKVQKPEFIGSCEFEGCEVRDVKRGVLETCWYGRYIMIFSECHGKCPYWRAWGLLMSNGFSWEGLGASRGFTGPEMGV
jgi:hypothetical protein